MGRVRLKNDRMERGKTFTSIEVCGREGRGGGHSQTELAGSASKRMDNIYTHANASLKSICRETSENPCVRKRSPH